MEKFCGLSDDEVQKRILDGKINKEIDIKTNNISIILFNNFFTMFNMINLFLALLLFLVGEYKNLLFMGVVIINTVISTFHEISAKRATDKLEILKKQSITCIRNSKKEEIDSNNIVLDDIIILKNNDYIPTDCIVLDGTVEVNESLITGEDDLVTKNKKDKLLSGSMVISGIACAKVINVGIDNYANKIIIDSKYIKKNKSQIMKSLNKIIKFMSYVIIPLGIIFFFKQYSLNNNLVTSLTNTVAAIIGMIPEGLVLLTSTVFALGIVKLAKNNAIIKNLYCIENLARVNTICFDKTGTLTKGKIKFKDIIYLDDNKNYVDELLNILISNSINLNSTTLAIKEIYNKNIKKDILKKYNFSSDRKFSGLDVDRVGTILLGAPEVLTDDKNILDKVNKYSEDYRTLLLAYKKNWDGNSKDLDIKAIILLDDELREDINNVIKYLYNEDINIKIITGDSPITTSRIAKKCGIKNYNKVVDLSKIKTDKDFYDAVKNNTILSRTSPFQKKDIIKILKDGNNNIAMIGDGVNDVMALKESDFSITFDNASNPAKSVSDAIILNTDFKRIPQIIKIGRKQIFNLERSASLFLVKTLYSLFLTIIFLFLDKQYPFIPIQLTLISVLTIGIPSFILALENTKTKAIGSFLPNVLKRSLATSLTIVSDILLVIVLSNIFGLNYKLMSTICVVLTAFTAFTFLYTLCRPFNKLKTILFILLSSTFLICILFFKDLFSLAFIPFNILIFILILFILSLFIFNLFSIISNKIVNKNNHRLEI